MILPSKKYAVIYADPPWGFATYSEKGENRSAKRHYDTMSNDDILNLPVGDMAADNCVLLLWATMPQLPLAFRAIERWGFKHKTTAFTWIKLNKKSLPEIPCDREYWTTFTGEMFTLFMGLGYYTRANPELCILATKGKPKRVGRDVRQVVMSPVREHSRKPDEMYEMIERLVEGPYVELFARHTRPGWDAVGNEAGLFDDFSDILV